MKLEDVENVILVASGKGGVGKTTVSADLAHLANEREGSVGLIDADISTPNSVDVVADGDADLDGQRLSTSEALIPPVVNGIQTISQEIVLPDDVPVMRDGEWRAQVVMDYIESVEWEDDTHTVIIDSPPGSGEEVQIVETQAPVTQAYIVTTPHDSSQLDARRTHEMFEQFQVPHETIVNMTHIPADVVADHTLSGVDLQADVQGVGDKTEKTITGRLREEASDFPLFGYEEGEVDVGSSVAAEVPYTASREDRLDALRGLFAREEVEA